MDAKENENEIQSDSGNNLVANCQTIGIRRVM